MQEFSYGLPNIKAASLYQTVTMLCKIGTRWAGTPGEAKARDYIQNKIIDCGLEDVRMDEFDYLGYTPILSDLKIISPNEASIPSSPLGYSANEVAEGEIIYAGTGSEIELLRLTYQFFVLNMIEV